MPALFLIWKPLFVPAIAFFMGTMLMFMHLPTGGMRKMPAQEQGRWHGGISPVPWDIAYLTEPRHEHANKKPPAP